MRYSVVDMTLQSGLGAVTSTKNVFLDNGFAEKVTGVKKNGGLLGLRPKTSWRHHVCL